MLADVFGCSISTVASKEGPALGVALLAGVGAGVYASVPGGRDAVIRQGGTQAPQPEAVEAYNRIYPLYRGLYPALKESYRALAAL